MLHQGLQILRRRWWVLLAAVLAVLAVSLARSLSQQNQYTATAALLFRDPGLDQKFFGTPVFAPSNDAQREAATNVQLVSLEAVSALTAKWLSRHGDPTTSDDVANSVLVEAAGQSNLVNIRATQGDPEAAARLANTFARQYIEFRRDRDREKVAQAQAIVAEQLGELSPAERAGRQGRELSSQNDQLAILKALQTGNAELVQSASPPEDRSSPRPLRSAVIAIFLGGLLGIGLMFLVDRLDRRIRDSSEIEEIFEKPILASIPVMGGLESQSDRAERMAALEPFRMLRVNLAYFNVHRKLRSVVVTSAAPGEGKTTVSMNLSIAAALAGQRVLLLEADLRRPTLAERLGIVRGPGLAEILSEQASLDEVLVHHELHAAEPSHGAEPVLNVVLAGAPPPNPAELLGSIEMFELLEQLEQNYDLVVIDTPPVTVLSDALPLLHHVRNVVVVARLNATTRESATRLRQQLGNADIDPLGLVVNAVKSGDAGYYGYDAYSLPARENEPTAAS